MSGPKLGERLRYRFDNLMSRGTPALIGLLAALSAVLVIVFGTVSLFVADDEVREEGLGRTLWMSMMRALDPGTVAGDEANGLFLFTMVLVTVGGLFIVAALVGLLSTGLDARLGELRNGRSRVVERGHTVLLGWSDQIFTMVPELVEANESERRSCIAVLADRDHRPGRGLSLAGGSSNPAGRTMRWASRACRSIGESCQVCLDVQGTKRWDGRSRCRQRFARRSLKSSPRPRLLTKMWTGGGRSSGRTSCPSPGRGPT